MRPSTGATLGRRGAINGNQRRVCMKTTDHRILVTGASSGTSAVLCSSFVEAGNHVIACGRRKELFIELSAKNDGVSYRHCELRDNGAIRELATELGPQIGILINCAEISQELSLTDHADLDAQLNEVDINLKGIFGWFTRSFPDLPAGERLPSSTYPPRSPLFRMRDFPSTARRRLVCTPTREHSGINLPQPMCACLN